MLNRVDVSNPQGGFLGLPLQDSSSGIVVKSIDGLDPVKATLVSSSFANLDGEQYHSSKRDKRNIVMTLGLDPDFPSMSVKELRQKLYSAAMPKSPVTLTFYDSTLPPVQINGYVESMETPLFAQDPEVQISILCFQPDFIDPVPVVLTGTSTVDKTEQYIHYAGTVDTGIILSVSPTGDAGTMGWSIRSQGTDIQEAYTDLQLAANSVLTIGSVPGNKYVYLKSPEGYQTSVLQALSPFSAWLTLHPGDNWFVFEYPDTSIPAIPWEIQYTTRYGGL